jgi:hypothetical protein
VNGTLPFETAICQEWWEPTVAVVQEVAREAAEGKIGTENWPPPPLKPVKTTAKENSAKAKARYLMVFSPDAPSGELPGEGLPRRVDLRCEKKRRD